MCAFPQNNEVAAYSSEYSKLNFFNVYLLNFLLGLFLCVRRWLSAAFLHHEVLWQGPADLLRHSETSKDAFLAREKQPFSQVL